MRNFYKLQIETSKNANMYCLICIFSSKDNILILSGGLMIETGVFKLRDPFVVVGEECYYLTRPRVL